MILSQVLLGLVQQWMFPTINNSMKPFHNSNYPFMLERLLKLAVSIKLPEFACHCGLAAATAGNFMSFCILLFLSCIKGKIITSWLSHSHFVIMFESLHVCNKKSIIILARLYVNLLIFIFVWPFTYVYICNLLILLSIYRFRISSYGWYFSTGFSTLVSMW